MKGFAQPFARRFATPFGLQTRISSSGPTWTPAELGERLKIWLDPSLSTDDDGTQIASVTDYASGLHPTRTPDAGAVIKTGVLNGKRVIRFNNTGDFDFPAGALGLLRNVGSASIVALTAPANATTAMGIGGFSVSTSTSVVRAGMRLNASGNAGKLGIAARRLDADSSAAGNGGAFTANEWFVQAVTFDWANGDVYLYKNAELVYNNTSFTSTGNTSDTNSRAASFGSFVNSVVFDGDAADYLVIVPGLTEAEYLQTFNYLNQKYNLEIDPGFSLSAAADPNAPRVEDAIGSWWSSPRAVTSNGRTWVTGVSESGRAIVAWSDGTSVMRQEVALVGVDDHNTPALMIASGKLPIVFYNSHSLDNYVRLRRATVLNNAMTLAVEQTINFGGEASYNQVFHEPDTDNLLLLARIDSRYWYYTTSSDYGATWAAPAALFDFGADQQGYLTCAQDGDTLHVALYGHPTSSTIHDIYHCLIDLSTGAITLKDSTALDNFKTPTSLPLAVTSALTLAYAPEGDANIRLYDISTQDEIAFCEWTNNDNAAYKYLTWNGTGWTKRDVVATGAVFGYSAAIHYHGGVSFPTPTAGGVMYLSRENSGTWSIEKWSTADGGQNWTTVEITSSSRKLIRPVAPVNADGYEVAYYDASHYGNSYDDYSADIVMR